jgi:hypothetical protein
MDKHVIQEQEFYLLCQTWAELEALYSMGGLTKLSMDYAAIIWFLSVFYISLYKICITYLLNMGFDFFFFLVFPLMCPFPSQSKKQMIAFCFNKL